MFPVALDFAYADIRERCIRSVALGVENSTSHHIRILQQIYYDSTIVIQLSMRRYIHDIFSIKDALTPLDILFLPMIEYG